MQLSNNKILITGATDGIGKVIAMKFLSLGNQIIAVGRNKHKLAALGELHKKIIPFECDVARHDELEALSLFIEREHSDLNILINNAGIQYNYDFLEESHLLEKITHEINVNLVAPIKLTALLLPILKLNKNAAIVNVSSGLTLVPKMQAPVYCGTKAGYIYFQSL